jgi:hypothetical protein
MITAIDIRYLNALISLPDIPIVKSCPECGEEMPEGYLDLCRWSEIHTVIDTRAAGATQCRPTLVIGCEGYHIMEIWAGEKNHDADL